MADDPVNPLVRNIQERLPWLFSEYGFRIVDYSYHPQSSGNCVVTLESESLRLRFHRDRGMSYAELASKADPDKWSDLSLLLLAIQGKRPDPAFEGTAILLKNNLQAITEALGPRLVETKQELDRREAAGREALAGWQSAHGITSVRHFSCVTTTRTGRVLLNVLRLALAALFVWALYMVFKKHSA
jgi:hypothetical protein